MKLIETRNLRKTYAGQNAQPVNALRGVDLVIEKGEFLAAVGPSGSGKSTLLHLIGGLDTPSEGSVLFESAEFSRMNKAELADFRLRHIGFIFQAYNLINVLTAVENVEYMMLLQNVPAKERRDRAVQILEQLGLGECLDRRPNQLSGGQQQRVTVARAIVTKPRLILADEPTANLDSHTALELMKMMRDLNEKEKITFVISTHDPEIMKIAKRIVHLKDGSVVVEAA